MSRDRAFRLAATSARVITGAVVAAACVAGVAVAVAAPWPTITHDAARAEVTPLPADAMLVCNGDFRAIGRDPSNPFEMVSAASARITVDGTDGAPASTPLSTGDLVGAGEVRRLTGEVDGRSAPLLGATESVTLAADDLFGFAAAPCRAASLESWLLGGSVATGTEDIVILTNPGAVPSTVTLTVYGGVRGSDTAIVPAGSQIALPLTAIAAGAEAPMIKVTATGAPVRAVLQSSLTRTLDPVGIDLQDAVAAPQRHPVIPGLQVFPSESDSDEAAVLRLLSPGADTEAVVTVREVGESTAAAEFTFPLESDEPTQFSLAGLEPGDYTVHVDADAPVLAAVREQEGVGPQTDFAWLTPAPELSGEVLVAVPAGPAARLFLVNDGDSDVTVRVQDRDGAEPVEVTVAAGSSAAVPVQSSSVYSVDASGPVHAAVAMSAAGALAVWPVAPGAETEQTITVYP